MTIDLHGIPDQLGCAGSHLSPDGAQGSPCLRDILRGFAGRVAPLQATRTTLAALDVNNREDNQLAYVLSDGSWWRFIASSVVADATGNFVVTPAGTPATGRWLRVPGPIDISAAFTFATPDTTALVTLPAGALVLVRRGYWKVTTAFTGGSGTPKYGFYSTNAGANTPGDLLGGAAGDGTATLGTTGTKLGTIGAKTAAGILLVGGDAISFNVFVTAFAAGVGQGHFVADILANPGA